MLLLLNAKVHCLHTKRPSLHSALRYFTVIRGSSVGIGPGYGLDDRGSEFDSRRKLGIFLFTTASRTALGPSQSPIQWVPEALSSGVKLPGREADHSPPSSAEVKNVWHCTSIPQYAFMTWCSVKKAERQLYIF
jgi:hypothetical protein